MTGLPTVADLPYYLPRDAEGQLKALAGILEIPYPLVKDTGDAGLEAMALTILFRHLEKRERDSALRTIHELESRELIGILRRKATDTAFVNERWGVWSMTNEELENDKAYHDMLVKIGGVLGFTFSATGGRDLAKQMVRERRLPKRGMVTIVIWVSLLSSHNSSVKLGEELERRTQQKSSPYY